MIVNFCLSDSTYQKPEPSGQSSDSSRFVVRTAQQRDLNGMADILADSFYSRTGIIGWVYPLLRLGIYEDLRLRIRCTPPNSICLVAVDTTSGGDCLVGTVEMALRSTSFWQNASSHYPYISNLAVRKSYRRRGVAQKLLLTCEQTALEWGLQNLYLHVLENNYQARQLYCKVGYRVQEIDNNFSVSFWKQPRKLFLHKDLAAHT